jgi:hypothetical protein
MLILLVVGTASFVLSSVTSAQVLTFEEEMGYTLGPLASPAAGAGDIYDKPFVGQGSWSNSTGNNGGHISQYLTDGLYDPYGGEQALDTNNDITGRYTGAKKDEDDLNLQFLQPEWQTSLDFDFFVGLSGARVSAGMWIDRDLDELFDSGENTFHAGVFSSGLPFGFSAFGVQSVSGTTYYSDGLGGVTTDILSAVQVEANGGLGMGWYHLSLDIAENSNGHDFDLTVSIQHLSDNPNMGLFVDFDANTTAIDPFMLTLSPEELGMDRIHIRDCLYLAPSGLFANVEGIAAIDNFTGGWSTIQPCECMVPEPSSLVLMLVGGLAVVGFARRRGK